MYQLDIATKRLYSKASPNSMAFYNVFIYAHISVGQLMLAQVALFHIFHS